MSILVKNMKMPRKCLWCPLQHIGLCQVTKTDVNSDLGKRADDCPLVELPEKHGDLIDRDEVRNDVFRHLSIKGEENLLPAEKSIFGNLIKAKAVIKAEGEE